MNLLAHLKTELSNRVVAHVKDALADQGLGPEELNLVLFGGALFLQQINGAEHLADAISEHLGPAAGKMLSKLWEVSKLNRLEAQRRLLGLRPVGVANVR